MSLDLVAYWQARIGDGVIAGPWSEAHKHCWRCWLPFGLERCHVVPASRGGPAEPSNLLLLCDHCHREQPNVTDPAAAWAWLQATRHYGYLRLHSGWWEAYEAAYGEPPLQDDTLDPDAVRARLWNALDAAVIHWGHRTLNAATLAACVRQAEGRT